MNISITHKENMINFLQKNNSQSGQVAIVILLIMVVLLTVGLSLASRTTQDLFLSQQESESARVFNAAEVGVDEALSQDFDYIAKNGANPITPTTVQDVTVNTTINPNDELETQIVEGAAVHVDLGGYGGTTMNVDWSRDSITNCDEQASLLISVYYQDGVDTKVVHEAIGPDRTAAGCTDYDDEFTTVSTSQAPYKFSTDIAMPATPLEPLFARVRAIYNDTSVRISGTAGFPTQFFIIRSEANTDVGEESRTVEVGRTLSGAPSFMDYSLYSGANIDIETVP